jgi:hypothetical protein
MDTKERHFTTRVFSLHSKAGEYMLIFTRDISLTFVSMIILATFALNIGHPGASIRQATKQEV